jgi:regulator of sigma D
MQIRCGYPTQQERMIKNMNNELKYFIEDMYDYISSGNWNEFKSILKRKGYTTEKIDELEERLDNFLHE